jgi:hypothetical protein
MVGAHPCLEELIARDMLQLGLSQKRELSPKKLGLVNDCNSKEDSPNAKEP